MRPSVRHQGTLTTTAASETTSLAAMKRRPCAWLNPCSPVPKYSDLVELPGDASQVFA
jgi:hypothetical protein